MSPSILLKLYFHLLVPIKMTMSENQTEQPNTIVYHLTDLFDIHQDIAPVESDDKDCILANTTVMHKLDVPPAMSANAVSSHL